MKLCECGCGLPTQLPKQANTKYGWVRGQPLRFLHGHNRYMAAPNNYRSASWRTDVEDKRRVKLHRLRAEKALGKPLPPKAHVHHADGSISDDAPLVICENLAYHFLLHQRMRIREAGGNPNTDRVCSYCHQAKPKEEFYPDKRRPDGCSSTCKPCGRAAASQYHRQKKALKAGATLCL